VCGGGHRHVPGCSGIILRRFNNPTISGSKRRARPKKSGRGKRKAVESTPSQSSDSTGSSDSTDTSADSTSSTSSDGGRRRKKGRVSKDIHWELVNDMWDIADRPAHLRDKKVVCAMSIAEISQYKEHYEKAEEKKGTSNSAFGRDQRPKKKKFSGGKDDSYKLLLQSRFDLGLPLCPPKKYWHKMPHKRPTFRHIPIGHLGLEGQVGEKTVLTMHDRRNIVKLAMFYKANAGRDKKEEKSEWEQPSEVRHLQEAVLNYVTILRQLWPYDYGGLVIMRVLVEEKWGEVTGSEDKARVKLVSKFFDDVVKENSGRAVRDQPPLEHDEVKKKWSRTVEDMFPNLTVLGLLAKAKTQQSATGGQQKQGGSGAAKTRGRGRGGATPGVGGVARQTAMLGGLSVCYAYNTATGRVADPWRFDGSGSGS